VSAGQCITGPALIEDRWSTVIVPPGWQARLDGHANLIITPLIAMSPEAQ
jgi:N-methylhydantoinase A/oxoprolinase/acetone carboxylase beta subunit